MFDPVPPYRPSHFRVKFAVAPWERRACAALRRQVFCTEQGLFPGDDRDAVDDGAGSDDGHPAERLGEQSADGVDLVVAEFEAEQVAEVLDVEARLDAEASVAEVLDQLEGAHPGFKERLLDGDGGLRRFVNLYVADDDVRFRDGLATEVADGDTVSIIPAVAGG